MPYKLALQLGGVFYVFMGLIILRKIVKKWFSELTTTSILIILALGTNLFYYATIENTMPHGYNFFLIIMFVYFTILFYENDRKKYKNAIVLGLLFGLISLIRPTNSLVIFIFIFYGVYAWSGIKNRILFLFNKPTYILLIGSLTLLIWFPQMLYWHSITGKWLYFSYGSGKTFNFLKPHVIEGLFSYRKGWFLYSTIFIFMFPGLWLLKQYVKNFTIGILVLFPLFIYVTFSWWCWWYGGYSSRPMVDMYGIFAIPLAAFLEYTYRIKNKIFKYGILVVLLFFTWKGSFGNFQYQTQAIHLDGMTKEAFWSSYLRLHPPHGFCEKLCRPDIEFAKKHIEVCHPMKL